MTKAEAKRLMLEADRDRARIAYRGLRDDMTDGQERATINLNRMMPEYKEADARFRKYSAIVGNEGPAALRRML